MLAFLNPIKGYLSFAVVVGVMALGMWTQQQRIEAQMKAVERYRTQVEVQTRTIDTLTEHAVRQQERINTMRDELEAADHEGVELRELEPDTAVETITRDRL